MFIVEDTMSKFESTELEWMSSYEDALESMLRKEFVAAAGQLNELKKQSTNRLAADPVYMAPTYGLCGVAELALNNRDAAANNLKSAKQYADMIFDDKAVNLLNCGVYTAQALMAFTEKDFESAVAFYERVDELKEELGLNINSPLCIAEMYFSEGRYQESIDWYVKAASAINENAVMDSDYYHLAEVQAKVAFAYFLAGNKEDALKVLESVAAIREHYNFEYSDLFINCGYLQYGLYEETGDDKSAYTLINFLVETCRDIYDYESEKTISALCFSAIKAIEKKDMSRAVEYLRLAADYVNTFFQTEEALWINKTLMEICEQQGDESGQKRYAETLSEIYLEQYTGDYNKDVLYVKTGDKGEAYKRQEKFLDDMRHVLERYSGYYISWVDEDIKKVDNRLFLVPVYSSYRSYLLELFNSKTPLDVPVEEEAEQSKEEVKPAEESDNLGEDLNFAMDSAGEDSSNEENVAETVSQKDNNSLEGWQEQVLQLIEGEMYGEAASLLLKVLGRAYAAGAKDMPITADIFRGLAEIHRRQGDEELASEMDLRAKVVALEI